MKRAVRRPDHELKPGGANRYDPGDGLSPVEHDDGLAAADSLKVLAQVGFEVSRANGRHDHMIVRRGLCVYPGPRGSPRSRRTHRAACAWEGVVVGAQP